MDVIGYASLIPFFMLYSHLERAYDGYIAVGVTIVAFLPVAAVWHFFYRKYTEQV